MQYPHTGDDLYRIDVIEIPKLVILQQQKLLHLNLRHVCSALGPLQLTRYNIIKIETGNS